MVDTGAIYTTMPTPLLRALGVASLGKRRLLLADGRRIEMDYGEVRATVDGETVTTLVVLEQTMPQSYSVPIPWKVWPWRLTRWNSDWFQPTSSCTRFC